MGRIRGKKLTRRKSPRGRKRPPGLPPGTFLGDPEAPRPKLRLFRYDETNLDERTADSLSELDPLLADDGRFLWLHVEGIGDVDAIRAIAERFEVHPLAIEDVLNGGQRPKSEPYESQLFLVLHALSPETERLRSQFSLVLSGRAVISFAEEPVIAILPVIERLRIGKRRIRTWGPGYLAYALIDAVIDSYYELVEDIEKKLDALEERVLHDPEQQSLTGIHQLRSELLDLKRSLWPLREMLTLLLREQDEWFPESLQVYLRDCHDHVVMILELLEHARESASNLMSTHMTEVSNRMNEVMKFLTLIATIFIPLSFIAGLYGMNFSTEISAWNMPELGWRYGYPFALGVMAFVAALFLVYFWRKGWFR